LEGPPSEYMHELLDDFDLDAQFNHLMRFVLIYDRRTSFRISRQCFSFKIL